MAPSNKQLDSSFCFASLHFALPRQALQPRRVPPQESSGAIFWSDDSMALVKSVRLLDFTRTVRTWN